MRLERIRVLKGPNIYHSKPVLVMSPKLGEDGGADVTRLPELTKRVQALFPRMELGRDTSVPRLIELVAIELSRRAGVAVEPCELSPAQRPDPGAVVIPFHSKKGMKLLLRTAAGLLEALARNEEFPLEQAIREANQVIGKTGLSFNTIALIRAAEQRGIPWIRLDRPNMVQLGYGKNRRIIQSSWTDRTSFLAAELAVQKHLAKAVLRNASIPVARGMTVNSLEEALEAFKKLGGPVVIKPVNGKQGKAVSVDLSREEDVRQAFHLAAEYADPTLSNQVLVEELLHGRDYRVLAMNGKVVAAVERVPAHVIGDGCHSIAELVEIENRNPLRGEGHSFPMCRIRIGAEERLYLEQNGLEPGHVPEPGKTIYLRKSSNGSAGGSARDVTDEIHPEARRLCEKTARTIGLDVCGIDLIVPDISKPIPAGVPCGVIEVNPRPGFQPHLNPVQGKCRNVARDLIEMLFPGDTESRISIISILGGQAGADLPRLLARQLTAFGRSVGMTGQDEFGSRSAESILTDLTVDTAILDTSLETLVREGLPYDWSDMAILTGAGEVPEASPELRPHRLRERWLALRLLMGRVRPGGTVILNADDPDLVASLDREMLRRPDRHLVLISLDLTSKEQLKGREIFAGIHRAYFPREGSIIEADEKGETSILDPEDAGGSLTLRTLALVAACRAMRIAPEPARPRFEAGSRVAPTMTGPCAPRTDESSW